MKRITAILLAAVMLLSLSACGHKHVWEQATAATPRTCTICGVTEGEPLGYNWGEVTYEWAEDNSSVTATRVSGTDASLVETETAAVTAEVTKEPTADEPGETTYTVTFENPDFAAQTKTVANIDKLGSAWDEPRFELGEDGTMTATRVSKDDPTLVETETAVVTAEVTKEPTADEPGETTYTASFENPAFPVQTWTVADIDKLGSEWGEPRFELGEDGTMTATRVSKDDPTLVETETAVVTAEVTKEPTADEPGETTYTASFENPAFPVQTWTVADIDKLGSEWGEPEYEFSADMRTVTATRVNRNDPSQVEVEIAEATEEVTKEPTCEEPGEARYSVSFGNEAFDVGGSWVQELAPLGHAWGEPEYEWAEDNSSVTATRVCLADASHTETETAPVTAEVSKEPGCKEPGETTYTAAFENPDFAVQTKTLTDIEASGHTWTEASYYAPRTCSGCGETEGEALQVPYFDMSFAEFMHRFNVINDGFLKIYPDGFGNYYLQVEGASIDMFGIDNYFDVWHYDTTGLSGELAEDGGLERFNSLSVSYLSPSPEFRAPVARVLPLIAFEFAQVLDRSLTEVEFLDGRYSLYSGDWEDYSLSRNGYAYALSFTEVWDGMYRYDFTITPSDLIR